MNSSRKSVNSIHINRGSSRNLCALIGGACFSACLSLMFMGLSGFTWSFLFIPVLLWRCIVEIRQHALLAGNNAVIAVHRDSSNTWSIIRSDNSENEAFLSSRSFLTSRLVILLLKEPRCWYSTPVIILPDSTDRKNFRNLLVQLRTSA